MGITDRVNSKDKEGRGYRFDSAGRFVIEHFGQARPFSSFLPGIAGATGIPLWVFTVNRGQAVAGFGVQDKDHPIMEFFPANYAYQNTAYLGFRTFIKLERSGHQAFYEPFAPWNQAEHTLMYVGLSDLELEATSLEHGLRTRVVYFGLPGEEFAALVRMVTVTNLGTNVVDLQVLDGMPRVLPHGVDNTGLKMIGRTLEAWMGVSNLSAGIPFYRFSATSGDTDEVSYFEAGNFYLAFAARDGVHCPLPALVDPVVVFGQNTSLHLPDGFLQRSPSELDAERQITTGRTPCGFFGLERRLGPGEALTIHAIVGHVGSLEQLQQQQERIARPVFLAQKHDEGTRLVGELVSVINTESGSPLFDAYCRQTLLDNILRGGWPLILGDAENAAVYHVYSRKHGDLERDYNAFYLAPTPYSQGNGNFRDVCQNRRCEVLLEPRVGDFDVLSFLGLVQTDGYNPLVVEGSHFYLPAERRQEVLALVDNADALEPLLAQRFGPGELLRAMARKGIQPRVPPGEFVLKVLERCEEEFDATFGEGYWIDHWFYILDLIDAYLAVYPERRHELLFEKTIGYFDSPAVVRPRRDKYVLTERGVRQYGAVAVDEEKAAMIASRAERPNRVRVGNGQGHIYRTTVMSKLVGLALIKFATLDPFGMGIEMEAGRPGWYDALNGLPGLLGSSLAETYELHRLLAFLLETTIQADDAEVVLPIEQGALLDQVLQALTEREAADDPRAEFRYWDRVSSSREMYRKRVRLGLAGETVTMTCRELTPSLNAFMEWTSRGIKRAVELNGGIPPTYFTYTVTEHAILRDDEGAAMCDEKGRPRVMAEGFQVHVLPLFLEGPMHAMKVSPDQDAARRLYSKVRESDLFDRALKMYKVNAPLEGQSHQIGRARAFTPGWLENESIWLHMAYKYLLSLLQAGLYAEFFHEFKAGLIPFQDPTTYGRSPLENSSFIVSSAHPDQSLHGTGYVARLSGSTAEFLSMWTTMMAGARPFHLHAGELRLAFSPTLPCWLFDGDGKLRFVFLGHTDVVYHNPRRLDVTPASMIVARMVLQFSDGSTLDLQSNAVANPYARQIREGRVRRIDVFLGRRMLQNTTGIIRHP